ncbi:MAG: Gfo/Idh/MocA family protein [Janthinobacterium lividum]
MTTIAIVGCAHIHIGGFVQAIKSQSELRCKTVWDHDPARAQKRAPELGAEIAADFHSIYADPEIEAVLVCTETNLHEQVVLPGAAARKHLFIEKPLGMGAADGYAMADAIEAAGVIYQTGFFMRGDPKLVFLKGQVENGAFGKITRARGSNCHGGALNHLFDTEWRWMADPKIAGVGGFGDLGAHALDILLWILGDVTSVTAQIDSGTNIYDGCDETGEGLLRFANGTIGTLAASWDDVAGPVSFLISGTEGHAAIINDELYFKSKHVEGADGKSPWTQLPESRPASLDAFFDAITGKDAALVKVRDAAYRSAVMEAMYQGARQNVWVTPATP